MENIEKIWAEGSRLSEVFREVLDQEMRTTSEAYSDQKPHPALLEQVVMPHARKNALGEIRRVLTVGEYTAIGFDPWRGGERRLEVIPIDFWPGSHILPNANEAASGNQNFEDIRLCSLDSELKGTVASSVVQSVSPSNTTVDEYPEPQDARPLAIAECYEAKMFDFDESNLAHRCKIYIAWIKKRFPGYPLSGRGFSESSFEADEIKFKENKGLLRS